MSLNDRHFIEIAKVLKTGSHCCSLKVGAVVVKDGRIISTGINGTPSGFENCVDHWVNDMTEEQFRDKHHEWSNKHEIHAEKNAVLFAAKYGVSVMGATVYTTTEPCHQCVKDLIQAGIRRVVYDQPYARESIDSSDKWSFAEACGLRIEQLDEPSSSESTTPCDRPAFVPAFTLGLISPTLVKDSLGRPWDSPVSVSISPDQVSRSPTSDPSSPEVKDENTTVTNPLRSEPVFGCPRC